ncbi:MAG: hypothetical protein U1E78_13585 [Gammaproteobacteria bacterium]
MTADFLFPGFSAQIPNTSNSLVTWQSLFFKVAMLMNNGTVPRWKYRSRINFLTNLRERHRTFSAVMKARRPQDD